VTGRLKKRKNEVGAAWECQKHLHGEEITMGLEKEVPCGKKELQNRQLKVK
jgi:hypothetical protein